MYRHVISVILLLALILGKIFLKEDKKALCQIVLMKSFRKGLSN